MSGSAATAANSSAPASATPPPTTVVSTVGAGDAFTAALIARLLASSWSPPSLEDVFLDVVEEMEAR